MSYDDEDDVVQLQKLLVDIRRDDVMAPGNPRRMNRGDEAAQRKPSAA